ncbi:MAG TPA: fused MFS/spermidine synthase [Candidatus Acidoferrales bacterium]|nr:fused MFS/spermidine synthase [Candidatus Acidoferrales bacterium]
MPRQLRLLISVFVSGAVVMALELLGSRLLAPVFGSSIFVWGSLIGVVLSALSAGYYLGGKLADIKPNFNVLSIVIFVAGLMVLSLPAIAPSLFDLAIRLNLGERYAPLLATILLLGPPSLLLGMVSPYAIRLVAETFETLGKASGNLYALSTLGSIVGTFLTVFILIPLFGVNKIIFSLGIVLLIVAFLGLSYRFKFLVFLILITLPFAAPYMVNRQLTVATYTLALGDTIYETDTPYHHLVVADAYDPSTQSTTRYLIMDDNLHSAMDLQNPNRTVFPYTDYFHIGLLLNPNVTHVLFIGGGGFTGPKAFLRDYPNLTVDVAEIDPEVVRVAEQYFGVNATNPRLHIYMDDGRVFLQATKQRYDLIVLDAYSRSYVPFHLMTLEFFKLVDSHLSSNGIVISNLISGTTLSNDQLLTAETTTIGQVFPNVYTFAVQGASDTDPQNVIIVATLSTNHLSVTDFEQLASTSSIVNIPGMKDYLANYFTPIGNNPPILTDNYAPVDTMLSPISGLPITNDQPPLISEQEALQILGGVVIVAAVAVILMKKKYL